VIEASPIWDHPGEPVPEENFWTKRTERTVIVLCPLLRKAIKLFVPSAVSKRSPAWKWIASVLATLELTQG